ncbi:MAG: P-loop NTPase, partial [Pseudomonadota bacterium]
SGSTRVPQDLETTATPATTATTASLTGVDDGTYFIEVTTPQDIALLDAVKGIEMFAKVEIPVLGIVENMSLHECPKCGEISHLFGSGGGERIAGELGVPLLGQLPLTREIREQADGGTPSVRADAESAVSAIYRDAARHMAARLWGTAAAAPAPTIRMVDD